MKKIFFKRLVTLTVAISLLAGSLVIRQATAEGVNQTEITLVAANASSEADGNLAPRFFLPYKPWTKI